MDKQQMDANFHAERVWDMIAEAGAVVATIQGYDVGELQAALGKAQTQAERLQERITGQVSPFTRARAQIAARPPETH